MNLEDPDTEPQSGTPRELLERWRQQSRRGGWRVDSDWLAPEAEALAFAMLHEQPLAGPAQRLGHHRSFQGVGIAETMGDFRALFGVAERPLDAYAMQQLVVGWVAATEDNLPSLCIDATTGMATSEHFEQVLYDVGTATRPSSKPLVLGSIRLPHPPRPEVHADWPLLAEIGRVCQGAFARRTLSQTYHHDRVHFLMERTSANVADALNCQDRLETLADGTEGSSDLTFHTLPSRAGDVQRLISRLADTRGASDSDE